MGYQSSFETHLLPEMASPRCTLLVAGIGANVSEEQLQQELGRFGNILSSVKTGENSVSITMSSPEEASHAASLLHGFSLKGHVLEVEVETQGKINKQLAGKLGSGQRYGRVRQSCDF